MTRKERAALEQKAFDIIVGSMEHIGEEAEIWQETKELSNSDLIAFLESEA